MRVARAQSVPGYLAPWPAPFPLRTRARSPSPPELAFDFVPSRAPDLGASPPWSSPQGTRAGERRDYESHFSRDHVGCRSDPAGWDWDWILARGELHRRWRSEGKKKALLTRGKLKSEARPLWGLK